METTERRKNTKFAASVGSMLLVGVVLLLADWMWFKGYPIQRQPQRFSVQFHNVEGLNDHAAVYSDGVRVGAVEDIVLKAPHVVRVSVLIDHQKLLVTANAQFFIHSNG